MRGLVLALTLLPALASAETVSFCWQGAEGWSMTGTFTHADDGDGLVTGEEVTKFRIRGYRQGAEVGSWDLSQRRPETVWNLNYDIAARAFLVGGYSYTPQGQAWNMSGDGTCGAGGFGFNAGAASQDLCLNGVWLIESGVAPDRPFPAGDCPGPDLIGKRR